jgi:intein/homing endonuclease
VFGVTVEDVEKALSGHDPTASGMAYFEPWQILNMRLMGLQRQAPYGHCVAGDTKVWCNPAVKNIVDVKSKDRVYMRHSGQLRSSEVIDRVSNGKKAIYKLKTVHREIRATENHEFLVYLGEKNNRWKQLKDINVGDKIIIATTMPGIGRPPTLGIRYDKLTDDSSVRLTRRGLRAVQMFRGSQKYGQKHDGVLTATRDTGIPEHLLKAFMTGDATVTFKQFKEIFGKIGLEVFEGSYKIYRGERTTKLNLPDFVTPWFCRLWGFMLGDGWIRGNQVVFARGVYPKLNRYYARLFEKIGLKVRLTQNKEQAYVDSQDLVNLLQDLGWKNGAHEKRVPNWIYGLPKKYREEFVAGFMDADGWDSDSDGTKAFHTELCNRELVRGLKTIIDGLGYKCGNIRKREGRSDSSIK